LKEYPLHVKKFVSGEQIKKTGLATQVAEKPII